jgi:hypothetical protein
MNANGPVAIVPFVPGGSDFARSRELMRELGFEEQWTSDGLVGFGSGAARFMLQDFDEPAFGANYMLKLEVPDLNAWYAEIDEKRLGERFSGFRMKPPTQFPWGREVNFIDLAGVCWHVMEAKPVS